MGKLRRLVVLGAAAYLCLLLASCSSGGGPTIPGGNQDDSSSLANQIKRQVAWTGDQTVADSSYDERRVDVSNVVMDYTSYMYRNCIHRHDTTPNEANDSQVVFAWQQYDGTYWRVKWRVAYEDTTNQNPNLSTVYTIPNPNNYNHSYPSITGKMKAGSKMTVDVVFQENVSGTLRIRHARYSQGTKDDYDSFTLDNGFPITVSYCSYNCKHPDVVYWGRNYLEPPIGNAWHGLFCVYEHFNNVAGSKGNRYIYWAKFSEINGYWDERTRIDIADANGLPEYPRIDTAWDESSWGNNGYVTAVVWHQYQYSGDTVTDIDIWGNKFAPLSPGNSAFEIWWDCANNDLDPDGHWSVYPYVDIDPFENADRFIHIVWTHFKDGYPTNDDPTNMYWNTEMADGYYAPISIHDQDPGEEGLITLAVMRGDGLNQKACATWIDDASSSGNFRVYATSINFSSANNVTYGARSQVSGGYSNDDDAPIYGPIPAVRNFSTIHTGWSDWDSANTDYGIYADWNTY